MLAFGWRAPGLKSTNKKKDGLRGDLNPGPYGLQISSKTIMLNKHSCKQPYN